MFVYPYRMKIVGLLLIIWGLYAFLFKYWRFHTVDLNLITGLLCWGLVFIFFSREKIDDERIHQVKFQALAWALPIGLFITHLLNYFFLSQQAFDSGDLTQSIPAYQSLALILLLALGLFHYFKHTN